MEVDGVINLPLVVND